MRIASLLVFFILSIQCKTKILTYEGYVIDNKNKPIENLTIEGRDYPYEKSITNYKGFFKIKARDNFIETFLYVKNTDGSKIDSIQVIRTHPEYGARYYFVNGRSDSLFINFNANDKLP